MKNIIFLLFFSLIFIVNLNYSNSAEYLYDFAFFCKSYKGDLKKSINLYKSFKKFNNKEKFYFVVPASEIEFFKNTYLNLYKTEEILELPIFITEEFVLDKCKILDRIEKGPERLKKGWIVQQMVKMCISQTKIAKDYATLDSDVYLVKDIRREDFYKNQKLKVVGRRIGDERRAIKFFNLKNGTGESSHRFETAAFVRYLFKPDTENEALKTMPIFYDFVSHYALWDSEIMNEIKEYVKNKMEFDFYDLIKTNPWEMQWYGQFIQSKHPERFNLMDDGFCVTLGYSNEDKKKFRCIPENGYKDTFLMANQSELGYKMPHTFFCKIKSRYNFINNKYLKPFMWKFIY